MAILDGVVLLLPLLFGLLALGHARTGSAPLLLAVYIYPMIVTLMVASPGYAMPTVEISESGGNLVRAGLHVGTMWILGLVMLWKGKVRVSNAAMFGAAAAAAAFMASSAVLAGATSAGVLRAGLLAVMAVNTILLVPTLVGDRADPFLEDLARGMYGLMLGVVCVALYVRVMYGPYPEWSPRLGRPLNPRVLAQLLLITLIMVTVMTGRMRYGLPLVLAIVASGSRLSIALTAGFLLVYAWTQGRRAAVAGVLALGAVVVAAVVSTGGAGVFARSDVSAGRLLLWGIALARIPSLWAWGIGDRFMLPVESDDPLLEVSRLHNGPLEAILSYGVWYALAAFALYGLFAFRLARRQPRAPGGVERRCRAVGLWLLGAAMFESIVGTSFWTNLGDTFSLVILIVLSVTAMDRMRWGVSHGATVRS